MQLGSVTVSIVTSIVIQIRKPGNTYVFPPIPIHLAYAIWPARRAARGLTQAATRAFLSKCHGKNGMSPDDPLHRKSEIITNQRGEVMKLKTILGTTLVTVVMVTGLLQLTTENVYAIQECNSINCHKECYLNPETMQYICSPTNPNAACICNLVPTTCGAWINAGSNSCIPD